MSRKGPSQSVLVCVRGMRKWCVHEAERGYNGKWHLEVSAGVLSSDARACAWCACLY